MMFPVSSRYYGIAIAKLERPGQREIAHLRRRFLPPAAASATLAEHVVTEDERLDNITARYLADPELFWRLCDANNALDPAELTSALGRRLKIPLPQ
jgi:hypothetical protein